MQDVYEEHGALSDVLDCVSGLFASSSHSSFFFVPQVERIDAQLNQAVSRQRAVLSTLATVEKRVAAVQSAKEQALREVEEYHSSQVADINRQVQALLSGLMSKKTQLTSKSQELERLCATIRALKLSRRTARLIQCGRELQDKLRDVENGLATEQAAIAAADEPCTLRLGHLLDFVGTEFRIPTFLTSSANGSRVDPLLSEPLVFYGVEFVLKVGDWV